MYQYTFTPISQDKFEELRYEGKKFFNKKFLVSKPRKKTLVGTITIRPRRGYQWDEIDFCDLVNFASLSGLGIKRDSPMITKNDFPSFQKGITELCLYRTHADNLENQVKIIPEDEIKTSATDDLTSNESPDDLENQAKDTKETQAPYTPKSQGTAIETLISTNLRDATSNALDNLENLVGNIDLYVAQALSFTETHLYRCFAAEQIDALALAIWNIRKGKGLILGDQTGVGKGRVLAGVIRYALANNLIPIFCTDNEKLYADIMRDIADVGIGAFKPFVTNRNLSIPLRDGEVLQSDPDLDVRLQGCYLNGYDAIFTTYYQLSTVNGNRKSRHNFLSYFARQAILILDESHQAGGKANVKQSSSRGLFARELADAAHGVIYSSATFAKNPESITLYSRTDMADAVENMGELTAILQRNGIPIQQAIASDLAAAGQYIRRERSYAGVEFNPVILTADRELAEKFSGVLADIMRFDKEKQNTVAVLDSALKKQAASIAIDNAIGEVGATSTSFPAIAHNLIDQFLLAAKVDSVVELAEIAERNGEKPVIAVANTMGAAIERYAVERSLAPGDVIDITFADLLIHYLERNRYVLIKDAGGNIQRRYLENWELSKAAVDIFNETLSKIKLIDFKNIPASPIDYILHKLTTKGIKTGEVTGRSHTVKITPERQYYRLRSAKERSKSAAVKTVTAFNNGELDALILNRSSSTGVSIHASALFADQRPRHLLIAQAERNINDFMQLLGRVHRTAQVKLPKFSLIFSDLPAEKRPGAVLCKKLASLNANTTSHRQNTGIKLDGVTDFMNQYGDAAAFEVMTSQPMLHEALGQPLKDFEVINNALAKVTGRIPLLPTIDEQEWVYDLIEEQYNNILDAYSSIEGNGLEASLLPGALLPGRETQLINPFKKDGSPFHGGVVAKEFEIVITRSAYPKAKVLELMKADSPESALALGQEIVQEYLMALPLEVENYLEYQPKISSKLEEKMRSQQNLVEGLLKDLMPGQTKELIDPSGNFWYGVVGKVTATPSKGKYISNPVAPSRWRVKFYLASQHREITISFSQLSSENSFMVRNGDYSIWNAFDSRQGQWRETRVICTGNLLYAASNLGGSIVKFLDAANKINYGLLMPQKADAKKILAHLPVKLKKVEHAWQFLSEATNYNGILMSKDQDLTVQAKPSRTVAGKFHLLLETQKSRRIGGKYYLHQPLLDAMEIQFYSVGNSMRANVEPESVRATLEVLLDLGLVAKNNFDIANKVAELESFSDVKSALISPTCHSSCSLTLLT